MPDLPAPAPARRGPAPTKHIDIVWAAARLFGRQGVAQTTTRQIAAEAGTTERTLFKHFGSKDGLVQAVIGEAVVAQLAPASLDTLRQAIERESGDLAAWHAALLRDREAALLEAPELTRLLIVELLRDDELRAQFGREWEKAVWDPLTALFHRLQRDGRVRGDIAAPVLARAFLSLNLCYLVGRHVLAPQAQWPAGEDIEGIARLFASGVAAPPPR